MNKEEIKKLINLNVKFCIDCVYFNDNKICQVHKKHRFYTDEPCEHFKEYAVIVFKVKE